jgi:hypothetical protein
MWPHVFRFLGLKNVRAEVRFAEAPIVFSSDVLNRKQAALEAREAVKELSEGTVGQAGRTMGMVCGS